jgi:pimeloyl-ACP methyl ester carboxylesterase
LIPENTEVARGRSDPTAAALAAEGQPDIDPTAQFLPTEVSIPLTVISPEGITLGARYFAAIRQPAPLLLMIHDENYQTAQLDALTLFLPGAGYHVLRLELRGYGQSGGSRDWSAAAGDIQAGLDSLIHFPSISRIILLAEGRAAAPAWTACQTQALCRGLVWLNPSSPDQDLNAVLAGVDKPLLIWQAADQSPLSLGPGAQQLSYSDWAAEQNEGYRRFLDWLATLGG